MSYHINTWIMYENEPYYLEDFYLDEEKFEARHGVTQLYTLIDEDDIQGLYPVDKIPTFSKTEMVICNNEIITIDGVNSKDIFRPYYNEIEGWLTPFQLTKLHY